MIFCMVTVSACVGGCRRASPAVAPDTAVSGGSGILMGQDATSTLLQVARWRVPSIMESLLQKAAQGLSLRNRRVIVSRPQRSLS